MRSASIARGRRAVNASREETWPGRLGSVRQAQRKIPLQPSHRPPVMAQRKANRRRPAPAGGAARALSAASGRRQPQRDGRCAARRRRRRARLGRAPPTSSACAIRSRSFRASRRRGEGAAVEARTGRRRSPPRSSKVDGYFAESARLRRALHEQQQPHAANAPAAELRKLRGRSGSCAPTWRRRGRAVVHRALVQEDRDGAALAAGCGVPTPRYRRRTQNTVNNEHFSPNQSIGISAEGCAPPLV